MKELLTWFHANYFAVNIKKTKAMPFHTWQNRSLLKPQITFNKMYIKCKYETKFLSFIRLKI